MWRLDNDDERYKIRHANHPLDEVERTSAYTSTNEVLQTIYATFLFRKYGNHVKCVCMYVCMLLLSVLSYQVLGSLRWHLKASIHSSQYDTDDVF